MGVSCTSVWDGARAMASIAFQVVGCAHLCGCEEEENNEEDGKKSKVVDVDPIHGHVAVADDKGETTPNEPPSHKGNEERTWKCQRRCRLASTPNKSKDTKKENLKRWERIEEILTCRTNVCRPGCRRHRPAAAGLGSDPSRKTRRRRRRKRTNT